MSSEDESSAAAEADVIAFRGAPKVIISDPPDDAEERLYEELMTLLGSERENVKQRAERVKEIVEQHPRLLHTSGIDAHSVQPLQHALENDAPVKIIKVLASANPVEVISMFWCSTYCKEKHEYRKKISLLRDTCSQETFNCLVEEVISYLHSMCPRSWGQLHIFFLLCCDKEDMTERMFQEFPDLNKNFALMNKAVKDRESNEVLQHLKALWYPRVFSEREDGCGDTPLHLLCSRWPGMTKKIYWKIRKAFRCLLAQRQSEHTMRKEDYRFMCIAIETRSSSILELSKRWFELIPTVFARKMAKATRHCI